jgi:hypothetical protein
VPARLGVPLVVLGVAVAWALLARALPLRGPEGAGPGFVPLLLASILGLLGLAILAGALKVESSGAPAAGGPGWLTAGRVIALLALYIAGVAHIGFLPVTPLYVALAAWQCGARSPGAIAGTAAGLTAAVWVVLTRLFGVPLP